MGHTEGNEYRQKAFLFDAQKCLCRYPGGFQRRDGRPAFGTQSCLQGLVCYLPFNVTETEVEDGFELIFQDGDVFTMYFQDQDVILDDMVSIANSL